MSYTEYNITSNATAYVDQDNPNTNYHTGDSVITAVSPNNTHRKLAFFKFPNMPSASGKMIGLIPTKKNGQINITVWTNTALSNTGDGNPWYGYCEGPWDPNTITFNNKPNYTKFSGLPERYTYVTEEIYEKIRQYGIVFGCDSIQGAVTQRVTAYYSMNSVDSPPLVHFTLFDSIPIATPIAPLRKFVDALSGTTFEWTYSNEYADSQKSYVLQISTDGVSWTELSAAQTSTTSVVIPAGTLTSIVKYWRVKVVSQSDFESEWSSAVQIVVISPSVCLLDSVTSTPRPVARWFCEGQQAFQAKFGDYETDTIYGTEKTYQCPIYLENGTYTVSVRTQGTNGLWSQWSSQTITVQNVPGTAIVLGIFATHRARLTWSGGENGTYYVLRDGVPIAKTTESTYTDQFVIGKHTYQVLEQLADGNYTLSNEATATMMPDHAIISPVTEASWQDINLSRESRRSFTESHTNTITLIHYVGRALPVAEDSGFVDKTMTFDVAFRNQKDASAFEALRGKIVCCKTKIGRMIIGILSGYTVDTDRWFSQYNCTITATDYQEAISYE